MYNWVGDEVLLIRRRSLPTSLLILSCNPCICHTSCSHQYFQTSMSLPLLYLSVGSLLVLRAGKEADNAARLCSLASPYPAKHYRQIDIYICIYMYHHLFINLQGRCHGCRIQERLLWPIRRLTLE